MRYACLVYHDENSLNALPNDELDAMMCECGAWVEQMKEGGSHVFSAGLQSIRAATTLRRRNGRVMMTDGPFAETKEVLGGFTIIDARDLNEAIQLASKLPAARHGSVEVRPILEMDAEVADPLDRMLVASIGRTNHQADAQCDRLQTSTLTRKAMRMDDIVSSTKAEYIRAKEQMVRALETTPDDRLNWSPSETCRTPLQIVAHSAMAVKSLHGMLEGRPFEIEDTTKADTYFRGLERQYRAREQVNGILEEYSAAYLAFLDGLTPERLGTTITLPFGFGTAPLAAGLPFAAEHMRGHTSQIQYIQTIYGDHDWHL